MYSLSASPNNIKFYIMFLYKKIYFQHEKHKPFYKTALKYEVNEATAILTTIKRCSREKLKNNEKISMTTMKIKFFRISSFTIIDFIWFILLWWSSLKGYIVARRKNREKKWKWKIKLLSLHSSIIFPFHLLIHYNLYPP